jgi:hypothetical protein
MALWKPDKSILPATQRQIFDSRETPGTLSYSKKRKEQEPEPPSQWNEGSRGGRTAKVAVALGVLPYALLMLQGTTQLRFYLNAGCAFFAAFR